MSEVSEPDDITDPVRAVDRREDELLLYDFFKHVTTLSLLVLGGMFGFADRIADDLQYTFLGSVFIVGAGGALAFDGAHKLLQGRRTSQDYFKKLSFYRFGAHAGLSFGTGMFLVAVAVSLWR